MQQLEAHEMAISKIFSSDYDFRIPEYQRPYAWETEQAIQLLDDLEEALMREPQEPYFLGSVVLVKLKESTDSEVIDGQQRLTTLTILLAVVRDQSQDPFLRRELEKMIEEPGSLIKGLEAKPRLSLRKRDVDFFQQMVQDTGNTTELIKLDPAKLKTDAQRSILANARALNARLEKWHEDKRLALVQMLGQRTFLVVVSTPNLDSAHRIFSVMNARGLDLSPADIFKSSVIGDLDESVSEEYASKWEDAEELLGREDFADLFLHIRTIETKERAKRELLKEFPEQVLVNYLPGKAAAFVDTMVVPYSSAYEQIRNRTYVASTGAEKINNWFKRLAQLDNNDWRPLALWALRHRGADPEWLDLFLKKLEMVSASMFIRRENRTPRLTRYLELLKQLDAGHDLDSSAFTLSRTEKSETLGQLKGNLYLSTKVRKYVLLRLDESLSMNAGVTYDFPLITVEHVLPQTPSAHSQWIQEFDTHQREMWIHRLANLVLLNRAKNSAAQNFDFDPKKVKYFQDKNGVSAFSLTSQVLATSEWTPQYLEGRQADLIGKLSSIWEL